MVLPNDMFFFFATNDKTHSAVSSKSDCRSRGYNLNDDLVSYLTNNRNYQLHAPLI